ncbi:unnamed protein product [Lupinus luteus]|uniref:Uncharacterized protein n=1 Tax=Lupinus luteus TaxID=3873 RepID=A0AAV1X5K9_LUPLU
MKIFQVCVGLFRRLNEAIAAWPACAEVFFGQHRFSPLGSRLCPGQLYLRTNRCPPRMNNTSRISGYKFSMSEEGQRTLENDRCTYNGPCHLELELKSSGSTIRLPSSHTQLEASFTLPSSRPPRELTLSETRILGIQVVGESSTTQRRCSDDLNSLPYVRAARRSFPNFHADATNEPMSEDSANEEMEDDECDEEDCVDLVDIVDSIEVINISSDKDNEEDPSEGSSSVNGGGGN